MPIKVTLLGIVTDVTPFYAEMGGEVGDTGSIYNESFNGEVIDCVKLPNGQHMVKVNVLNGEINIDDEVTLKVNDVLRNKIQANHTATHLLDQALKDVLSRTTADTMTESDIEEIKRLKDKMMESANVVFTKMYEQAGAQYQNAQAGPTPGAGPAPEGFQGDDVVDGDYKEI